MTTAKSGRLLCPICDTVNRYGATRCYLCGESLSDGKSNVIQPGTEPTSGLPFMMLVFALIAVFFGVWTESPMLAVLIGVPSAIALIRTFLAADGRNGRAPTALGQLTELAITFGLVIVVMVSSVVAFVLTYSGVAPLASAPPTHGAFAMSFSNAGILLGLIAAIGTAIGLTVAIVRFRGKKPRH